MGCGGSSLHSSSPPLSVVPPPSCTPVAAAAAAAQPQAHAQPAAAHANRSNAQLSNSHAHKQQQHNNNNNNNNNHGPHPPSLLVDSSSPPPPSHLVGQRAHSEGSSFPFVHVTGANNFTPNPSPLPRAPSLAVHSPYHNDTPNEMSHMHLTPYNPLSVISAPTHPVSAPALLPNIYRSSEPVFDGASSVHEETMEDEEETVELLHELSCLTVKGSENRVAPPLKASPFLMAPTAASRANHAPAHVAAPTSLFHGFYSRRCMLSASRALVSSGMGLTLRHMFEELSHDGVVTREQWCALIEQLGLSQDSSTSLTRLLGIDTATLTLDQFVSAMALSLHGPYLRLAHRTGRISAVFLGGVIGDTTWRQQITIPILQTNNIPFYNPQSSSQLLVEQLSSAIHRARCHLFLFVVPCDERSVEAMVEASELITGEKEMVLVLQDAIDTVAGKTISPAEKKDLNRGRAYLADVAKRGASNGTIIFKQIEEATQYVVKRWNELFAEEPSAQPVKERAESKQASASSDVRPSGLPPRPLERSNTKPGIHRHSSSVELPSQQASKHASSLSVSTPLSFHWPAQPTLQDYDSYIDSSHFVQCSRTVYRMLTRELQRKGQLAMSGQSKVSGSVPSSPNFTSNSAPLIARTGSTLAPTANTGQTSLTTSLNSLRQRASHRATSSADTPTPFFQITTSSPEQIVEKPAELDTFNLDHADSSDQLYDHKSPTPSGSGVPQLHSSPPPLSDSYSSNSQLASDLKSAAVSIHFNAESPSHIQQLHVEPVFIDNMNDSQSNSSSSASSSTTASSSTVDTPSLPTLHLFILLCRLHELIKISSGIEFVLPTPFLVSVELEKKSAICNFISYTQWLEFSQIIFHKLRCSEDLDEYKKLEQQAIHSLTKSSSLLQPPNAHSSAKPSLPLTRFTTMLSTPGLTSSVPLIEHANAPTNVSNTSTATNLSPAAFIRQMTVANFEQSGNKRSTAPSDKPVSVKSKQLKHGSLPDALSSTDLPSNYTSTQTLDSSPQASPNIMNALSHESPPHSAHASFSTRSSKKPLFPPHSLDSTPLITYPLQSPTSHSNSHSTTVSTLSQPPEAKRTPSLMKLSTKRAISTQRTTKFNLDPIANVSALASTNNTADGSLSADDRRALENEREISLQRDQTVFNEMLSSFQSMFNTIEKTNATECITKENIYNLFFKSLLLPLSSVNSLMAVIDVAIQDVLEDLAHKANERNKTDQLPAIESSKLTIDFPQFCSILCHCLHLTCTSFSYFLSSDVLSYTRYQNACVDVFLGGSCNPTTWRQDAAIPILFNSRVTFYNPQVDNWSNELVLVEALIKQNVQILLFVIDEQTRSIASLIEAAEYIKRSREVVLVVKTLQVGSKIGEEVLDDAQLKDLNRGRHYLIDVAQRHGLDVFTDVELACKYIVSKLQTNTVLQHEYSLEVESFLSSEDFHVQCFDEFNRCVPQCSPDPQDNAAYLTGAQLLRALVNYERDLRPLLPIGSKHRVPCDEDVKNVLRQFGYYSKQSKAEREQEREKLRAKQKLLEEQRLQNPHAPLSPPHSPANIWQFDPNSDLNDRMEFEGFLAFSKLLFRNVCAHVRP